MEVQNGKQHSNDHRGESGAPQADKNLSRLTVKELEMLPKLEEIEQLDGLTVGGTTNISERVIAAITYQAASEVEGVAQVGTSSLKRALAERLGGAAGKTRGVVVEAGRKEAILDIAVRMFYSYPVPLTVILIRQIIADRLLKYCGLVAKEINVKVVGLEFPEGVYGRVE